MPAQTRGFLFSDLRGYSAFTERHGDRAARELLGRYRRIVRDVIARFGGAEIRTEGDSFYVVFSSVSEAVEAGVAILAGLGAAAAEGEHPIQAGIGIHAGEVEDSQEGIVSTAVNIAARICAVAAPGEVLVSDTVRSLTRGYLDVSYVPQGRRRLKGIAERMPLYRVIPAGPSAKIATRRPVLPAVEGRQRIALVGAGVVLVLVSTVLGATLLRESFAGVGGGSDGDVATRPTGSPEVSTASAGEPSVDASADATSFPNDEERYLLELVPEPYRPSCERASAGSLPPLVARGGGPDAGGHAGGPTTADVRFDGGIACAPFGIDAPDELSLWTVSEGRDGMRVEPSATEWITNRAAWLSLSTGECAPDRRALEYWEAGPLSGLLICFSTVTQGSTLYWTYDGADVIGRAIRADGDLDALLTWWRQDARIRRP